MNFASKSSGRGVSVAMVAVFFASFTFVYAGPPGRSIEISAPKSETVSTNLQQLSTAKPLKDELIRQKMNENLFRPFNVGDDPLAGISPAPVVPRQSAPSAAEKRRMKEWMQKNQDWILMNPEEWEDSPEMEKILKTTQEFWEGEEGRALSSLERLHNRAKEQAGPTNQMKPQFEFAKSKEDRERDREKLSGSAQNSAVFTAETNSEIKAVFGETDSPYDSKLAPIFSEVFRSGNEMKWDMAREQERAESFRQILAPSEGASGGGINFINALTSGNSGGRISSVLDSPGTRAFSSPLGQQDFGVSTPSAAFQTPAFSDSSSSSLQPSIAPAYKPTPPPQGPSVLPLPRRAF